MKSFAELYRQRAIRRRKFRVNVQTPATRCTDPVTSHMAAEALTKSGRRNEQQEIVLAAVERYPGRTARELERDSGLDYYVIMRRINEVVFAKCAKAGKRRRCAVSGNYATEWWPTPKPGRMF